MTAWGTSGHGGAAARRRAFVYEIVQTFSDKRQSLREFYVLILKHMPVGQGLTCLSLYGGWEGEASSGIEVQ